MYVGMCVSVYRFVCVRVCVSMCVVAQQSLGSHVLKVARSDTSVCAPRTMACGV